MTSFSRTAGLALLLLLLAACGSLNSEPRIVSTLPPAIVEQPDTGQPVSALSEGARIFSTRCTPCHGDGGRGDGPLIRAGQIAAPPDFTQPSTMTVQGVQAIFEVVSAGRIDRMMPPWEGALSQSERQAVAEFVAGLGGSAVADAPGQAP